MKRRLPVIVLIISFVLPVAALAADQVPPGFIAISDGKMTYYDAKKFCEDKGGRLPYVGGGSAALKKTPKGTSIEVFGAVGSQWPASVPKADYWTGTDNASGPRSGYVITTSRLGVDAMGSHRSGEARTLCIAK